MSKSCGCFPFGGAAVKYDGDVEDADAFPATAKLKGHSVRSMSMLGNFVKEFEGSVWESYEQSGNAKLGRGAGGEVVEASNKKNKRKYAVKIINISNPKYHSLIVNEKTILQDLDHLNCVRLYEVFSIGLTQMWFVMELCTGGHLGQYIAARTRGYLTEASAKVFVTQLVSVVAHCHERLICHRDIKLANILMENKTRDTSLKLIDFGNSSRFQKGSLMKRIAGTTYSTAPEVFQRKGYDERCDVWSIGVMAYIMLCGRRPFERIDIPNQPEASEASLISSILLGRYHFNHAPFRDVSDEAIHFVCTCFEPYGRRRVSAAELMNHPWLKSANDNDQSLSGSAMAAVQMHLNVPGQDGSSSRGLAQDLSSDLSLGNIESQANYAKRTDFSRTSMLGVAFSIPPGKTRLFRKVFNEMDTDNTGFLDRKEFFEAVMRSTATMKGLDVSGDVNALFDMIDIDGNGQISFLEFLAATIDPRAVDIQDMNQAFRLLDKEERGYITVDDFRAILQTQSRPGSRRNSHAGSRSVDGEAGTDLDEAESGASDARVAREQRAVQELQHKKELESNIARMIAEVDVDGDGRISYSEFLFAMSEMPQNTNFVPMNEKDIAHNETMDAMHRKRHLQRANSDGVAQQAYSHSSNQRPKNEQVQKTGSASGGIFSRFTKKKSKNNMTTPNDPLSTRSGTAPPGTMGASPMPSSSTYFSNTGHRNQSKVHVDIAWTKTPDRPENKVGPIEISSGNNIKSVSLGNGSRAGSGRLSPTSLNAAKTNLEKQDHSK